MSDTYKEKTLEKKNEQDRFFQVDIKNRFIARLEDAMNGEANVAFAQKCGISEATIRKYRKGETTPNLENLEAIAKVANKPIWWFLSEDTESKEIEVKPPSIPVTFIDKFEIVASAGYGSYIDSESVIDEFPFTDAYLRRHRLSSADLCIIESRGDSMEPTIESGADLLINRKEFSPYKVVHGVHVLNLDGELKVKRLEFDLMRDGYRIISDNSLYEEDFLPRSELERLRIIGEVAMVLGKPSDYTV
ncbi:XRE family transcriptional regulator [Enterovibrio nigricans]|uniref:Helix-turn-helix n=1 Tax=Enterovibrio nigricans DSM 22720 TaxID=1121868 RepID=A0A1T4VN59_9GAMM|nr:XRE family transcriptional regulator [Enterovibrio nigricans]SKA66366.1 Helix-turn-helix [Enterovibrio nigricans DSM 22720]